MLNEIDRESHILSSWSPDSEISRWSRTRNQPVAVSPELFEVLGMYDRWRDRTNGALDASAGEVIGVWKAAEKAGHLPSAESLEKAVAIAGAQQWKLDPANRTATHTGDATLVLASFTKSYIIDHAADAAMRGEVRSIVLNVGGDIVVRGTLTEPVDVADPLDDADNALPLSKILLHDRAIATSGDYRRGFDIGGRHYSHIVRSAHGLTAEKIISSTVIAPRPSDAGALATAFCVMTPEESAKLAASFPELLTCWCVPMGAGRQRRLVCHGSKSISKRCISTRPPVAFIATRNRAGGHCWIAIGIQAWSSRLTSSSRRLAGPRKRPFVAAWIEDADHFQVRTLAVWFTKIAG